MHYRVTRPRVYGPGTPGYTDPGSRQGYYCDANSGYDAALVVQKRLRSLGVEETVFDVQDWDNGPTRGQRHATYNTGG